MRGILAGLAFAITVVSAIFGAIVWVSSTMAELYVLRHIEEIRKKEETKDG